MVGRYVILDELGRGGMGAVFTAWDTELGRRVALKLLISPYASEERKVRLRREAQAMARLSHPNVVTVYDVGTHDGQTFIAMELIDGGTLGQWLRQAKRGADEVMRVLLEAGRGLAAAHAAGLVHRDFKPGNVLIAKDGRVVVTDFGLARTDAAASSSGSSTPSGRGLAGPPPSGRGLAGPPPSGRGIAGPPPSGRGVAGPPASAGGDTDSPTFEGPTAPIDAAAGAAAKNAGTQGSIAGDAAADGAIDERVTLDERVTHAGAVLGTVGYMAPEQVIQRRDDARSDQFAFCVTAYRALYGTPPFEAKRILEYTAALRAGPAAPRGDGAAPKWIWPILKRGMSFEPDGRFASMDELLEALSNDPTRARRRRIAAGAAALVAVLAVAAVLGKRRADVRACTAEGDAIGEVWGAAAREKVVAALAAAREKVGPRMAADVPSRTAAALDRYAASWRAAREQACVEALGRGGEIAELTARRDACLDRGKEQLAALVTQLAGADEQTGAAALRAAIGLPRPEACAQPAASERPLPSDATMRLKLLEIRRAESRALALRLTGRPGEALAEARRAADMARLTGDARIEADALRQAATLAALVGDPQAAVDTSISAIGAAERGGDDAAAGSAAAFLAKTLADRLDQAKEAERWIAFAEAKLARVGKNEELEGEVLESRALALELTNRLADALPLYDRLLALEERAWGKVSERVLAVLNNKAIALGALGRFEEALALHRRGIEMGEALYGPTDLDLAIDYHNMSRVLMNMGRYGEAEQAAQRSYDLRLVLGPASPRLCWPISMLAGIAARTDRPARALEMADKGLAIADAHPGAVSAVLPSLLMQRGEALVALGKPEPAAEACGRALALLEKDGPLTPDKSVEEPLTCLGLAKIGQGKLEDGIALLERAVTLVLRDEPVSLALSRFALARALHQAGRDPDRARKLAEQAAADLRKAPAMEARLHEVERWLAAPFGFPAARD
jgi:serine/threonine protein kinase/tetratricopeptide (TPR) repeat protein